MDQPRIILDRKIDNDQNKNDLESGDYFQRTLGLKEAFSTVHIQTNRDGILWPARNLQSLPSGAMTTPAHITNSLETSEPMNNLIILYVDDIILARTTPITKQDATEASKLH